MVETFWTHCKVKLPLKSGTQNQIKPQNNNKSVRKKYRICSDVTLENISLSVEEASTLISFALEIFSCVQKVATVQKSIHFLPFI